MPLRGQAHLVGRCHPLHGLVWNINPSSCLEPDAVDMPGDISASCPTLGGRKNPNSHAKRKSRHANAMAKSPQRSATD